MNKITVHLFYPSDFKIDDKDIELTEFELEVLSKCNKIGSEGKYFEIEEWIFEDTTEGKSLTIKLKNEDS